MSPGSVLPSMNVSVPGPPVTVSLPVPLLRTSSNGVPIRRSLPAPPMSVSCVWSVGPTPFAGIDAPRPDASSMSLPSFASIVSESCSPRTLCRIVIA